MVLFRSKVAVLLSTALCLSACTSSEVGSDESNATDSSRRPTDKGALRFDVPNKAEFTDEQRHFAWTFSLTDKAEVAIGTEVITDNLAAALFLYKKNDRDLWGRPKWKSAPIQTLDARVSADLDAGDYRIKLQAARKQMRGHSLLHADCDGPGCATPSTECGPNDPAFPAETGYTKSCAVKMAKLMGIEDSYAPPCVASRLEKRVSQWYRDRSGDWATEVEYAIELEEGQDPMDVDPWVDVEYFEGGGTRVNAQIGEEGENAVDYIFDAEGNLLLTYQGYTGDLTWHCGVEGEDSEPEITGYCVSDYTEALYYAPAETPECLSEALAQ